MLVILVGDNLGKSALFIEGHCFAKFYKNGLMPSKKSPIPKSPITEGSRSHRLLLSTQIPEYQ